MLNISISIIIIISSSSSSIMVIIISIIIIIVIIIIIIIIPPQAPEGLKATAPERSRVAGTQHGTSSHD